MIFISTGHHPYSKGASCGKFNEFDEAKIWASLIAHMVGKKAMLVPVGVLREKVAFINSFQGSNIAVEIHFNSAVDGEGNRVGAGSETLYFPGSNRGEALAQCVQEELCAVFPPDRGAKEGWYRMDKSKGANYFLARTRCPAIIIEPEFIHRRDIILSCRENGCKAITIALNHWS